LLSSWFRRYPEQLDVTERPEAVLGRAVRRSA
jgi:hypothetical protein